MMSRIRLWLDALRTSLWFVPTLIVLGSVVLAYGMLAMDAALPTDWWKPIGWLDPLMDVRIRGATAMLQMIGGSIITIAGVVFSITIAAVTLAAGQYTSRVLRNFIRDRANQTVLGSFLGIFVYCVLVLRSLSGASPSDHAPALALLMALALAFLGIGVLIFFIHHIVKSLQATNVVAVIARDALPSMDRHFPERFEPSEQGGVDLRRPEGKHRARVHARRSGYVTGIDFDALVGHAVACDGLVRVRRRPGMFVAEGEVLAELQTPEAVDGERLQALHGAWSFATQRTLENDPGYGLRQLVDVALKALSPGVNETTTGVMCVNWLGVMLLRMAGRRFPAQIRLDEQCIRVVTNAPRLGDFIDLAFDQIRQNAAGNVAVLRRLLEVLLALAESDGGRVARLPILRQAEAIEALMTCSIGWEPDREPLRDLLDKLRECLGVEAKSGDAAGDSRNPDSDSR
jgi:uncharacterized membrane protein